MKKISPRMYGTFVDMYVNGMYPYLRFGQAFIYQFVRDKSDPEVFYATDQEKAHELIKERYVEKVLVP